MTEANSTTKAQVLIERQQLPELLELVSKKGYKLLGPMVRDGAIVYDEIAGDKDLPIGWTDTQSGGSYCLKKTDSPRVFGFTLGQQSWKSFFYPPTLKYWTAKKENGEVEIETGDSTTPRQALIGVRACELAALAIHDKVLMGDQYKDPHYAALRENSFIVALNCSKACGTCFCDSMKTGPRVQSGYDLALTEVVEDGKHYFIIDIGSMKGTQAIHGLAAKPASIEHEAIIDKMMKTTKSQMKINLDTNNLKEILWRNFENPQWDAVDKRCLSCSNCTMVCPTCFCISVEENTDLTGTKAERIRRWDSCFRLDFSYIFGGSIRPSTKSRYRQWLTHKLSSWVDQFGTFGCVGCGRCITWCPVGINIAEEATAIRKSEHDKQTSVKG
jgi:sulfhydrogenase subunit beta (sulfur reductase)